MNPTIQEARHHFDRIGWFRFKSYAAAGQEKVGRYAAEGDRTAQYALVLMKAGVSDSNSQFLIFNS